MVGVTTPEEAHYMISGSTEDLVKPPRNQAVLFLHRAPNIPSSHTANASHVTASSVLVRTWA